MEECMQCDERHGELWRVRYRWTRVVVGENPYTVHEQYVCARCRDQLRHMATGAHPVMVSDLCVGSVPVTF